MQNLQSYAFSSQYGQFVSTRIGTAEFYAHTEILLSIFATRLETWVRLLQLLFWHTKHWKAVEGLNEQICTVPRKLGKTNQSFSNNHTCVCSRWNNSGTTIDLEARFIQSLEKVLKITFQHKAALGLQYEDQNLVRKSYHNTVVRVNNTVTFDNEPERAVRELQIFCCLTPQNSLAAIHYHTAAHRVHSKNSSSSGLVTSESFMSTVASFS